MSDISRIRIKVLPLCICNCDLINVVENRSDGFVMDISRHSILSDEFFMKL